MGKRKQPFGYKMKLGEIVPQPQEAEAVRSIYLQYLAGASFKQLAEQLQTEDVPYDEDKSWNKNMVARILEDDRYIGEKEFPALIPTKQFHAAQERRKEMCPEYKQTPAQKELRKLCGGIVRRALSHHLHHDGGTEAPQGGNPRYPAGTGTDQPSYPCGSLGNDRGDCGNHRVG